MASFLGIILVIMVFMASPSLSLLQTSNDHQFKLKSILTIISAAPAVLPCPPSHSSPSPVSPFTDLSPDISPLFPKTGGKAPPPPSSIPTIPSNPSPPNPDQSFASTSASALSPSGSLPDSAAVSLSFLRSSYSAVLIGILVLVLAL